MGESSHHQHSRLGLRNAGGGGEIVEVQGGHIVRSTGRKDRHSKVCTAKGPRDRRVRLAAHTAIQFYDVQDRLGYDRPSKAVDWLIKKAKAAIDELAQLPAWTPATTCSVLEQRKNFEEDLQQVIREEHELNDSGGGRNSSFLPPSLDSDAIADTIKSFFPVGGSGEASSSAMEFQSQDLRLSLQSFQDPMMLHQPPPPHDNNHHHQNEQAHVFLTGTPLGFDGTAAWMEHHQHTAELSRFQRLTSWNPGGETATATATAAGDIFYSPAAAPQPLIQQLLGHNQYFSSQRGPLQSSNTSSIRAWMDPSAIATADQTSPPQHNHPAVVPIYSSSFSGIGFTSGAGGFSGFHIPARIQGDEEEHDGYSDKPSSVSSHSRH